MRRQVLPLWGVLLFAVVASSTAITTVSDNAERVPEDMSLELMVRIHILDCVKFNNWVVSLGAYAEKPSMALAGWVCVQGIAQFPGMRTRQHDTRHCRVQQMPRAPYRGNWKVRSADISTVVHCMGGRAQSLPCHQKSRDVSHEKYYLTSS